MNLGDVIDLDACQLGNKKFVVSCKKTLAEDGVLTLPGFLRAEAIETLVTEAETQKPNAYFTASTHNVYLTEPSPNLVRTMSTTGSLRPQKDALLPIKYRSIPAFTRYTAPHYLDSLLPKLSANPDYMNMPIL